MDPTDTGDGKPATAAEAAEPASQDVETDKVSGTPDTSIPKEEEPTEVKAEESAPGGEASAPEDPAKRGGSTEAEGADAEVKKESAVKSEEVPSSAPMEVDAEPDQSEAPAKKEIVKLDASGNRPRKRARSPDVSGNQQSSNTVSAASVAASAQLAATMGWNGIYSLLIARPSGSASGGGSSGASGASSLQLSMMLASASASGASSALSSTNSLPTPQQVHQAVTKYLTDIPPYVHLSKADSAPQLKLSGLPGEIDDRLSVKGGMRGYRMARATHGVSSGNFYYEVVVLPPPKVSEIVASLPTNARLGKALQAQLQAALKQEQEEEKGSAGGDAANPSASKKKDAAGQPRSTFGGHIRLGWSMRTGDLQAPVGYDKWSFGIRDIGGSKIHCSRREDNWGGVEFGVGDVIGCAISLYDPSKDVSSNNGNPAVGMGAASGYNTNTGENGVGGRSDHENHIRFFKNGQPMGQFVISKGKREGGMAFQIPNGVYYPAISLYMGASCRVNFGPHFIYPPKRLPPALKNIKPISDLCPKPMSVKDAVAKVQKEKTFRKPDKLQAFQELVQAEVQVLHDFYDSHYKHHVKEISKEREQRSLSTAELDSIDTSAAKKD